MSSYKKIAVGTDGSATSMSAVDRAAAIAADCDADLLIVTAYAPATRHAVAEAAEVLGSDAYLVTGSTPAERMLSEAADRAIVAGAPRVETLAVPGSPVAVLDRSVTTATADLLVVGNVGLNTLAGRILGSVPQSLARRAGVDILIVHTS